MGAMMTPAARFHNALRIMLSIDVADLRNAGIVDKNWGTPGASDRPQLAGFIQDPIRESLRMPDDNFDRLFALIESRQPRARTDTVDPDRAFLRAFMETEVTGSSSDLETDR